MKLRNILALAGLILALAAPVLAESVETRYENGEKVYTNPGAQKYRRTMRVQGTTIRNRQPAPRPRTFQDLPPGTPAATGPVPREFAFSTFGPRTPRPLQCYAWKPDASGRLTRQVVTVDLNQIILKHARAHNVDPLLIELVIRYESNFNPGAVSPAGAQGLMQLMPGTAAGLGVSDPFDPDQNVRGGTKYIADQLRRFKSLPLALAAYNAGPGAVLDHGGIPPYAETQYYVNAIYGEYRAHVRSRSKTKR